MPGIGTIPGGFEYPIGAGGRDGHHITIRGIMSIIGLPRVDGRVLGFFMFPFYTFQQVYRPPVIFDRTLDAIIEQPLNARGGTSPTALK